VSGRLTDGYLTASGNFEADMNGMSGGVPYYQAVAGTFFLYSGQTRFPCSLTVSFWRNTFTSSDPPASSALTDNRVRITCLAGQFAIQGGEILLNPGEFHEWVGGIPLSSSGDPRSSEGTYGGFATCDYTQVSIQARIEWNVQPRVHILLGIVRECYEEPGSSPCATFCDGDPANEVLYLTISNYTGPEPASGSPNGTYVLERFPGYCDFFMGGAAWGCHPYEGFTNLPILYRGGYDEVRASSRYIAFGSWQIVNGECKILLLDSDIDSSVDTSYCGTGVLHSGVGKVYVHTSFGGAMPEDIVPGSFDWEIEA
jgi:hypothetical protein